ncbi:MAG TPA: CapA family protein [Tepidisphaeraceae bacterium]|nr:CapA family protein [Tepidisphaeraceae bacterium]
MPFALFCGLLAGAVLIATVTPGGLVRFVAVGDIMLSRNVAAKAKAAGDPYLPFRGVAELLDSSDFNFGNLESPFAPPAGDGSSASPGGPSESDWDGVIGGKSLVFGAPNKSLSALARFNFRVLSMANNHALDQDEAGLLHTIDRLAANGIRVVGAGANLEDAWRAQVVERQGRKIAFLAVSYASLNYGTDERNEYVARIEDLDRLRSQVRALKSQAEFVAVAMHAGNEYTSEPTQAQVDFAHAAIDAGASLVVGSHPHWLQRFERYRGGLIFYSLGNFVFDLDSSPDVRVGAAVRVYVAENNEVWAEVIPVEIENGCCPRPSRGDEITRALERMGLRSARIALSRSEAE